MEDDLIYNAEVKGWGNKTLAEIKSDAGQMSVKHRNNSTSPDSSIKALRVKFRLQGGTIKSIAFKIRQHLVFVNKGVGRDTPISQAGTTNRKAKPFIIDPIDANIEELADMVAEHTGNSIMNRLQIK